MLPGRATVLLPHTVIQTVCVEMLPGRAYPYGTVCDRVVVAARLAVSFVLLRRTDCATIARSSRIRVVESASATRRKQRAVNGLALACCQR